MKQIGLIANIKFEYDRFMSDPQIQFGMNASMIGGPLTMEASLAREASLLDDALVVRGGIANEANLLKGSGVVVNTEGKLAGVSVRSANMSTVEELTQGGVQTARTFPNNQISVTTVGEIRNAGGRVVPDFPVNPNNPFHCEICGLFAAELEKLFTQRPNPLIKRE